MKIFNKNIKSEKLWSSLSYLHHIKNWIFLNLDSKFSRHIRDSAL